MAQFRPNPSDPRPFFALLRGDRSRVVYPTARRSRRIRAGLGPPGGPGPRRKAADPAARRETLARATGLKGDSALKLSQIFSAIGLAASVAAFAIGAAIAVAVVLSRPELGPGLKSARIIRQPAAPLLESIDVSEPLRRLLLARSLQAPEAEASRGAKPSLARAAVDRPEESAGRSSLAALARERTARRMAKIPSRRLELGPNQKYHTYVAEAAILTGLSPAAIAALIDAEARKTRTGHWDPKSANPTSSALGLAQFVDQTWLLEARRTERFLHQEAKSRGLIDRNGAVETSDPKKLQKLLAMRLEPRVAIIAAAEMAADNLMTLARWGYAPEDDDAAAKLAYLAHHEGLKGARGHLAGVVNQARAEKRLKANLTEDRAERLLEAHDDKPHRAYAAWLEDYIQKRIKTDRFHAALN